MVVHYVGEMVGRKSVALEQYGIGIDVFVFPLYVAEEFVVEFGGTFERHGETDDVRLFRIKAGLDFLGRKGAAVPVVAEHTLVHGLDLAEVFEPFRIAEAVVSLTLFDEFKRVFLVELEPLGLDVRGVRSAPVAALVPVDAEPGKGIVEVADIFFAGAGLVGILEA